MEDTVKRYRTIFISDFHLGTGGSQAEKLLQFLRATESETLYLVGDVADGWRLRQRWFWPQTHSDVLQELLKKPSRNTRVIYIPGNHDEFARDYIGFNIGEIEIAMQATHITANGLRLLVLHGDEFDLIIRRYKWLGLLGTRLLAWIQFANRINCWIRHQLGLRQWSLAAYLKQLGKGSSAVLSNFEHLIATEAKEHGYDGLVCGHTHKPCVKQVDGIMYYNDGDWVDNCTALVEHYDGRLELLQFGHSC